MLDDYNKTEIQFFEEIIDIIKNKNRINLVEELDGWSDEQIIDFCEGAITNIKEIDKLLFYF